MSQANVTVACRWFEEVWNQRRSELISVLSCPESVGHLEGGDVTDLDGFRQIHSKFLNAFPDLRIEVEDTAAEGDNVVVRWLASGTHQGDSFGLKSSGRAVRFRGMTWMRIRDGQIVEAWDSWNQGALFRDLAEPTN